VKLDTIWINVQRYSHNHALNCIFGPPYGVIRDNISTLSKKILTQRNFVAEFHRENASFIRKTAN